MNRQYIKAILSVLVVCLTAFAFIYYFKSNPEVGQQLRQTSAATLVVLIGLYAIFTACIGLILNATVRLCKTVIPKREILLVTMYSAIINFFGPLQSGPAFRAAYLKKKHSVSLKLYGLATIGYYAAYALINAVLLLSGWSLWVLVLIPIGLLTALYLLPLLPIKTFSKLDLTAWLYLCIATVLQIATVALIFYLELHGMDKSISVQQALIYTGAANLALFVSVTPGAIGFRESFLFFSQRLHNVPSDVIVSANILDRSAYITLLLLLAVYLFVTHTSSRLVAIAKK